jgi:REP element-mobilizing transposase RayT
MAHTFTDLLTHVVFSTSEREPFLSDSIRLDVHAYIGGILREMRATPIAIGGTSDHIHLLFCLPADKSVADCLRVVKANSSRWIKEKWSDRGTFAWQRGYGAFSVSQSNRAAVIRYVEDQARHHMRTSFRDEFVALLKKHGVEFEEEYLWR